VKFRTHEFVLGILVTVALVAVWTVLSGTIGATVSVETADERVARYTWWLAVLTAGLVFGSAVQFYFLARAQTTSQDLAALAREEFIATHRPRVIVRFLQGPHHDEDGNEFYWVTFANTGETAATITEIGGDLARRNIANLTYNTPGIDASPKPVIPIILESGERHVIKVTANKPVSDIDLFADAVGSHERVAAGRVRYKDGNGRMRETAYFRTNRGGDGFHASSNREEEYED
jgi:hypothetical protein